MSNFTHRHYQETLKRYRSEGYAVTSFRDHLASPASKKFVILRHDVDLSLDAALRMAELDSNANCTSTWFFRLHATNYSIFTLNGMRALEAIKQMGHEIGFHFEPSMAYALNLEPVQFADRQKQMFEALIGGSFAGLSAHEPARADRPDLIEELCRRWKLSYHAYEPRFTKEIKYISDSSARWREGCFSEWVNKVDRLQILVHPFWWYKDVPQENY